MASAANPKNSAHATTGIRTYGRQNSVIGASTIDVASNAFQ
jgi:hypothetical protein